MSKFKVGDRVVVIKKYMQCYAIGKEGIIIGTDKNTRYKYSVDFGKELEDEHEYVYTHDCCGRLKNYTGYRFPEECLELVDEDLIYSETIIGG